MKFILSILVVLLSFAGFSQTGKSGTITIEKEKDGITGLYRKTNIVNDPSLVDAQVKVETNSSYGRISSNTYFYFLKDGRLYQITSDLKPSKVLELAKSDPVKLRPVLASYMVKSGIIVIMPYQESISEGMEPTKAYFEGKVADDRLFLTKRKVAEITVFEKVASN